MVYGLVSYEEQITSFTGEMTLRWQASRIGPLVNPTIHMDEKNVHTRLENMEAGLLRTESGMTFPAACLVSYLQISLL